MSQHTDYSKWCKDIHTGGLGTCTFCCNNIGVSGRLQHYRACAMAKRYFDEVLNTETILKSRDVVIRRDDTAKRTIKLSCAVLGIEQDYWDTRMPRGAKYKMEAYEDSLGTALHNLYRVSLRMIEESLLGDDDRSEHYTGLGDIDMIFDLDKNDDERETKVENAEQVKKYLVAKLMTLEIGRQLTLSFDNHEVVFKIWRTDV
jgi:hypothetical protein